MSGVHVTFLISAIEQKVSSDIWTFLCLRVIYKI
jgi:hypothetical protein